MTTWFTANEAAAYVNSVRSVLSNGDASFTERGIRNWVNRGHFKAGALDEDGRQLFRLGDVARAELATRAHALRTLAAAAGAT